MHGVQGAEKLTELFGRWPSFHDAEVISLVLDRSGGDDGFGPSLVATIRAFDITDEVLPDGFLKLTHECAAVMAFREVVELQVTDFNSQNVLSGLHIIDIRDRQLERQHFEVWFAGVHGLDARFQCRGVEVLAVTPI